MAFVTFVGSTPAFAAKTVLAPTTPTAIKAKPEVAAVKVSWLSPHRSGVTFTVTSVPNGKGCVVVGLTNCTIPVTDSTPWQFQVTASIGSMVSAPSALTSVVPDRTLVILAGQSNAMGAESLAIDPATGVNYLAPPYLNGADTSSTLSWPAWNVKAARHGGHTGQVALDTPQIENWITPDQQIFGPEVGWARQVFADTGQPISIIKATLGGSSLAVNWNPSSPGGIFLATVGDVVTTMQLDARAGRLDTIGAIAWYQGENDAMSLTTAGQYETNLGTFISALRSDLPMASTTPIVLVKESLASLVASWEANNECSVENCTGVDTGDAEVRSADDWAAANLPHVIGVDSLGLPRFAGDEVHLTDTSELVIGKEIATASDHLMP